MFVIYSKGRNYEKDKNDIFSVYVLSPSVVYYCPWTYNLGYLAGFMQKIKLSAKYDIH
jgi:hypothetical protein